MRNIKTLGSAEAFLKEWNQKHGYTNIFEIQTLLRQEETELKLREIRGRIKGLDDLEVALLEEISKEALHTELRQIHYALIALGARKREVLESVIDSLMTSLTEKSLAELFGETMPGQISGTKLPNE